jgi:amidase
MGKSGYRGFLRITLTVGFIITITTCKEKKQETVDGTDSAAWIEEMTIKELQEGYSGHKFTVNEVVTAYLTRIKNIDKSGPSLNSIITINPDAIKIADSLDRVLSDGKERGPLFGVPVLLKDNIDTHDKMPTTAGSRALADSHPANDSFVTKKLREAGAIILGKSNLSEWANFRSMVSSSGWSGGGGQTKNPYVLDRNPCGSSSGSGVAVSANLCMVAIGTETNGSIVCPSNNNGIVGLKPTVGLISRSGIIPISFSQDTPGPMGRCVEDVAIMLGAMTGSDTADSKTLIQDRKALTNYSMSLEKDGVRGKRIGYFKSTEYYSEKSEILADDVISFLRKNGATVVNIEMPKAENYLMASSDVLFYEFKDGLNNYLKSLGPNARVKNLNDLIAFNKSDSTELKYFNQNLLEVANKKGDLNSPDYKKALEIMEKGSRSEGIDKIMDQNNLDALMAPTGSPAWKTDLILGDHYVGGSSSLAAIAGYPAITVPMGFINNLPVGITFFGKAWSESKLIGIAYSYEQGTRHRKVPKYLVTD